MIVLSLGIDLLKHLGYSKAVDYTWEHGRSCLILSFFFAINTVIGLLNIRHSILTLNFKFSTICLEWDEYSDV